MKRELLVPLVSVCLWAPPIGAEEPEKPAGEDSTEATAVRRSEEVHVESASKVETTLVNAPATMSVVTAETLATNPAQNYADLLRAVPGMNAIQTSARDLNLTTRQSTSTLNNSQLVLVDGRSVYLDFFGLVLWDFVPSPGSSDIKQIEVVRGPASVVWGANALTGVINIITKTPRENQGFGLTLGAGLFGRSGGSRDAEGAGTQLNGSFSYGSALDETWAYRLSAGYFNSDPYSRPVGTVPLSCHPLGVDPCRDAQGAALPGGYPAGGATYPAETSGGGNFVNNGTSQPKVDLRVDQEVGGGRITYQGGYAGTEGIIHTGIGPFDIQSGSYMAYGKALFTKGALRISGFGNFVDADAPNLLQTDPGTLQPVVLGFETQTYDFDLGHSTVLGGAHVLTYGGNLRRNNFDITLAPLAEDRTEFGAYFQEEYFTDRFRLAVGARADKFGNLDNWVFSPRVSAMFKPTPGQSIRASYNRAFRSPSVVNNYLDQDIFSPSTVDLRALGAAVPPLRPLIPQEPFFLVLNTFGNTALKEEHIDAFELAYTAAIGRTAVGVAVYQNDTNDNVNFTYLLPNSENPQGLPGLEFYTAQNPAQGVGAVSGNPITLSPALMSVLGSLPPPMGPVLLPHKVATYLNLGPVRNRGLELSLEHRFSNGLSASGNYSWQDQPEILDADADQIRYPVAEVGVPPKHRFNVGVSYDGARALGSLNLSYSDQAFWNDVLNEPYWGYTDSYALLNATAGVKLAEGKVTLSLRATNLLDENVLQHVYGDLMRRSVMAELRVRTR
jgi:iron complex outermembrane receptor protein